MSWGVLTVGRLTLKESYRITDATNAQSGIRTITLEGVETATPTGLVALQGLAEDLVTMMGQIVAVTFSHKTDRNGFYAIDDVNTNAVYYQGEALQFNWSIGLTRIGPDNAVAIESRLSNVIRANDFALAGERWHAPAIGHYAYHTGSTMPSVVTRTGESGAMTVYRAVPANVNPRWGSSVTTYGGGRARLLISGTERAGTGIRAGGMTWELNNGLVKVSPATNVLNISHWTGGAWRVKPWLVYLSVSPAQFVDSYDQMTVLRNDHEAVVIRLVKAIASGPGVATLDLTLRRGSSILEGYLQRSNAPDAMMVTLSSAETYTNNSASGYVFATPNDASGNRFAAGSARSFTATANGGVNKNASATLDFWVGLEVGGTGAVAGNQAVNLRDQYIAVSSESTAVTPR